MYEIYRKDKVSDFWRGIRPTEMAVGTDEEGSLADDDSVKELDKRYDALIAEADEDGGNIWQGRFSIQKLQEAALNLRFSATSRLKETKKAVLFEAENGESEDALGFVPIFICDFSNILH